VGLEASLLEGTQTQKDQSTNLAVRMIMGDEEGIVACLERTNGYKPRLASAKTNVTEKTQT
jgi:hypothetical protein